MWPKIKERKKIIGHVKNNITAAANNNIPRPNEKPQDANEKERRENKMGAGKLWPGKSRDTPK